MRRDVLMRATDADGRLGDGKGSSSPLTKRKKESEARVKGGEKRGRQIAAVVLEATSRGIQLIKTTRPLRKSDKDLF